MADSSLLAAPKTAARYAQLSWEVEKLIGSGAEYSGPTSGSYRQSVQLEDLNADGVSEAIVFLRTSDELPLMLCLFEQQGSDDDPTYTYAGTIKLEGTSFNSIVYSDMNGDGSREMLVCSSLGSGLPRALSVIEWNGDALYSSLSISCAQYALYDLDADGASELIVSHYDAENLSGVVETYSYNGHELAISSAAPLSQNIESISLMTTGKLLYDVPAVFVVSTCDQKSATLTDIIAYRLGSLVNITLDEETGRSVEYAPVSNMSISDIGGDGVSDIPYVTALTPYDSRNSSETYYKTIWHSYRLDGVREETYQTFSSGDWYFILPDSWKGSLMVEHRDLIPDERTVVFSAVFGEEGGEVSKCDIMSVYVITGDNREDRSSIAGRFVIDTRETRAVSGTVYAARLFDLPPELDEYKITAEEVCELFRISTKAWTTN